MPAPVSPAVIPTPSATPATCGSVRAMPNRAPEAVSRITLGPGVKRPAKTNR